MEPTFGPMGGKVSMSLVTHEIDCWRGSIKLLAASLGLRPATRNKHGYPKQLRVAVQIAKLPPLKTTLELVQWHAEILLSERFQHFEPLLVRNLASARFSVDSHLHSPPIID